MTSPPAGRKTLVLAWVLILLGLVLALTIPATAPCEPWVAEASEC